jgi:hypothetical protein
MGTSIRFHRRIRLGSFFRINLNKNSVSLTAGRRRGGPHATVSSDGSTYSSIGIPGTGVSVVHRTPKGGFRRLCDRLHITRSDKP